jgi:hypothetical protein
MPVQTWIWIRKNDKAKYGSGKKHFGTTTLKTVTVLTVRYMMSR